MNKFYMGCVVNRLDPLFLGRSQVRILGLHSAMEADLANDDLPWAVPIQPTTSAANSGVGWSPTGLLPGTWCVIIFADENQQIPMILGTVGGQIDLITPLKAVRDQQIQRCMHQQSTSTEFVSHLNLLRWKEVPHSNLRLQI